MLHMMKTALVVEDDPTIRLVLRTNLENDGLRALEAETAEAALVMVQDEMPDIVLVDLRLPGIHVRPGALPPSPQRGSHHHRHGQYR